MLVPGSSEARLRLAGPKGLPWGATRSPGVLLTLTNRDIMRESGTSKLQEVPLHLHQALLHPVVLLLHILGLRQEVQVMDTVKAVVTITEEEEELPMVEVEVLLVTNTEVGIVEVGPLSRDLKDTVG